MRKHGKHDDVQRQDAFIKRPTFVESLNSSKSKFTEEKEKDDFFNIGGKMLGDRATVEVNQIITDIWNTGGLKDKDKKKNLNRYTPIEQRKPKVVFFKDPNIVQELR